MRVETHDDAPSVQELGKITQVTDRVMCIRIPASCIDAAVRRWHDNRGVRVKVGDLGDVNPRTGDEQASTCAAFISLGVRLVALSRPFDVGHRNHGALGQPGPHSRKRQRQSFQAAGRGHTKSRQPLRSVGVAGGEIFGPYIGAPHDTHFRRAPFRTMQPERHFGIRHRARIGLCPRIDVRRQKHRRVNDLRVDALRDVRRGLLELRIAEVEFTQSGTRLEPLPRGGQRTAVHGVIRPLADVVVAHEDGRTRRPKDAEPIETPEPLSQRVQACALRHERIEVEVGPCLDALRGHHDDAAGGNGSVSIRRDASQERRCLTGVANDACAVEGTHSAGQ